MIATESGPRLEVPTSFAEFTLKSARTVLGLDPASADLFADARPVAPPRWLLESFERADQGTRLSLISEKARSEFVVAPVLLAARELSGNAISIYSGERLDVDPRRGLTGECDFIVAASDGRFTLRAPIAVLVEAKKNDIEAGLGQCLAQMCAAAAFNEEQGRSDSPVYGCVTTGELWQFLKLDRSASWLDRRRYHLGDVDRILGAFLFIAAETRG